MLEKLDDVRVRLLEAIAALPDVALTRPGAAGDWSIADILAHFVNWEAELVTGLLRIDQGKKPARLLAALADREAYNAQRYPEMKDRDLDRIFDDLQGVRVQLEEWLEEFSDRDLQAPGRYPWLGDKALWQVIAACSFEHEAAHLPAIENYAERWLREEAGTISLNQIGVTDNGHSG
jgi:hypothetical protein